MFRVMVLEILTAWGSVISWEDDIILTDDVDGELFAQ